MIIEQRSKSDLKNRNQTIMYLGFSISYKITDKNKKNKIF